MEFINKLRAILTSFWPIIALVILNSLVALTNYKAGTYLTGWDNLHPEFNFGINIQRSLFAVWQEYQSLGLLGGMGHATDLIRQVFLYFLSFIFPNEALRYVWTFLTLYTGSLGAYFLIKKVVFSQRNYLTKLLSFIAALFYTLNLATVQNYYAPYEAFSVHFASLPWLILASVLFIKKPSFKNLLLLSVVLLLSTPSFYIPTLFIVYILSISIYLLVKLFTDKKRKNTITSALKLYGVITIINSFWLFPFLYFTLKNASVNLGAKINQMATTTIFLQNKEFGNVFDVALLKGFWFNNVDPNLNGDYSYMLMAWRDHLSSPFVMAAGFALFGIILLGVLYSFLRKKYAFFALFLFSFTMLTTETFPFSLINELFRQIPLFDQAFRFPFTKFNSLAALTYSIMLAFGIYWIYELLTRFRPKIKVPLLAVIFIVTTFLIFTVSFPIFRGHLFYEKETIKIPDEYFQTFEFFKNQDQNTRIANLPQPTFWGWTFYRWGYGGSGFLWYGIKQPILDRAFDVWSATSENYYYELSTALYSEDKKALENVLNKYQISWILLDKNIIYPQSPKSLLLNKTEDLIDEIQFIGKEKEFGNIIIYKVDLADNINSFVYTKGNLPKIGLPFWKTADLAYDSYGTYKTGSQNGKEYFFGSLFSQKNIDQDFEFKNGTETINLTKTVNLEKDSFLNIPSFFEIEKHFAFVISKILDSENNTIISATLKTPEVLVNGKRVWGENLDIQLFTLPASTKYPLLIDINGSHSFEIRSQGSNEKETIGTGYITDLQQNSLLISGENFSETRRIDGRTIDIVFEGETMVSLSKGENNLAIKIPKIDDKSLSLKARGADFKIENCDYWRKGESKSSISNQNLIFESKNSTICSSIFSQSLSHSEGYIIAINSKNVKGRTLHFWILNEDKGYSMLDVYLEKDKENHLFTLPPMEQSGRGYSFHLDNQSIGQEESINSLKNIEAYSLPFKFLSNITIDHSPIQIASDGYASIRSVLHPQESLYIVSLTESNRPTTLILSQSFDYWWKAYEVKKINILTSYFPFIFGEKINSHMVVNDWANGWIIEGEGNRKILIVYLPQYLQYTGFLALLVFVLILAYKARHNL